MKMKQVALITGASSGIGRAAAELFSKRGYTVYAAARNMDALKALAGDTVHPVSLDVTDDASMQACVKQVLDTEGRIDVLVNNAGYGSHGATEDVPMAEARRQMDVNLFGLARMIQLVLPPMRKAGYGRIINIASMGGRVWTPFAGWYIASKFAVEGLSACLRLEVKPFGIDVIVVEPGGVETPWGEIAVEHLRDASQNGAYAAAAERTAARLAKTYAGRVLSKPETIAKCIVKAATAKRPRTRYLLGLGAKPLVYVQKIFGDRAYDALVQKFL
jgi:NAD(P)-dependent dehydrogenase (short-subunit alcohol dehydrogenase family)